MARRGWIWFVAAGCLAIGLGLGALARAEVARIGELAPDVAGGPWIGSPPLTIHGLRGRVTLVEFWTFG
jgi:hypothetical protein